MAIFQTSFYSTALHRNTDLTAIIPAESLLLPEKEKLLPVGKLFKVIVLLHGFSGNHSDWLRGSRIEQLALKHNVAVLCPSGENSFYIDDLHRDALYEQFVCSELLSFARKVFPISEKREDTTIGGLSMGGYGALRNGLKNHDVFGNIMAFSSALITDKLIEGTEQNNNSIASPAYYEHIFGKASELEKSSNNPKYLAKELAESGAEFPQIYMACGAEDFLIEQNRDFSRYLEQLGVKHDFYVTPGEHNWDFWDEYIEKALQWLEDKEKA